MSSAPRPLRFAIIGAGMSGILSAIKLRERGHTDFTLYEKAEELGGTWRDNTYPGLSCDVPSHLYSYSFALNPEWNRRFAAGAEIQAYLEGVARSHDVVPAIRFRSEVTEAAFKDGRWALTLADGTNDTVDVVIAATGVLHRPVYPDIPGHRNFAGAAFHSARWDHSVPLEGKRVGIIGTGSTAIQIVSAIVDRVARLDLYQRTAQWVMPAENPIYSEAEKAEFRRSPEALKKSYDYYYRRFVETFARAVVGDRPAMKLIEEACRANLEDNVKDPELRRKLTPDYQVACKRLIMSDSFYQAIQRPNARLVTEAISRIEAGGVRTADGRLHELDVLVFATGYDGHNFLRPMKVVGPGGQTLDEAWKDSTQAYRSVAVPGFPNFFMLVGPNSPIGNFSVIMISELQLAYVLQLVDLLRAGRCKAVAPKGEATSRFNRAIREAMPGTVWVTGCRSWYLDKTGFPAMWPWPFEKFREDMRAPDLADFELAG
ncbi:MAG: NAD(P)/FAD-dependent oxidoreductase [Alphaproteobacteria bacterium]|nr:NAD(P)/FAD-dependent oxidoreductase [Alphaproteobacteria bacterium]